MKVNVKVGLLLLAILLFGCNSTNHEKISIVHVTGNGSEPHDVVLSRSVIIPISNVYDAMFIMEECLPEYHSSLGEPTLNGEIWYFFWGPEYPDWEISVDRNTGDVIIGLFG